MVVFDTQLASKIVSLSYHNAFIYKYFPFMLLGLEQLCYSKMNRCSGLAYQGSKLWILNTSSYWYLFIF